MLSRIGGRFSLEDVSEEHLRFLFNFRASGIRKWFFDDRLITWSQHLAWFKEYVKHSDRLFAIFDYETHIYIGTIGFIGYNEESRITEFGRFGINSQDHLGKGYGTLIIQSLFNYVFRSSKTEIIVCEVIADNRIVDLYTRLGFVVDGFEKDYESYPGRMINKVSMILSKERFYENNRD